jgi:hypothetical protein
MIRKMIAADGTSLPTALLDYLPLTLIGSSHTLL